MRRDNPVDDRQHSEYQRPRKETAIARTDPWYSDDADCRYYDTPSGNIVCPDDDSR